MSTFEEEYYSIERTKEFMYSLLDPKQTPKVPKYIREHARRIIKHYPICLDLFIETGYNTRVTKEICDEQKDTTS